MSVRKSIMGRAAGVLVCAFMTFGTIAAGSPAELKGWRLAFTDDFERALVGPHWQPLSGMWSIDKGRLTGNGQILCAWRFPGPQRLEYDARSRDPSAVADHKVCDLSAILATGRDGVGGGYFFGFGSNQNTCSKLLIRGKQIARYDEKITLFKTYHVVCEFDGARLTHQIDGKVVHSQQVKQILKDAGHEQIGFYMWLPGLIDNVQVYTRTGQDSSPQKRSASLAPPPDPSLIRNGSFEEVRAAARPRVPVSWLAEGWTLDDRVKLVTDAPAAHRGQRFLRLAALGERGIRMHSLGAKELKPGGRYVIRLWAHRIGENAATLRIEPGHYQAQLGLQWKLHEVHYTHPPDAKPVMGMFFEIKGGLADVDDVSLAPEAEPEPMAREVPGPGRTLTRLPVNDRWLRKTDGSFYEQRIPILVRENAGQPARNHVVSVSLRALFRTYNYDFVCPEKIRVVDSTAKGPPPVPWGLVATHPTRRTDPNGAVADDRLVFPVDIPPLSHKIYYVYLADRRPGKPLAISDQIPASLNIPSAYAHVLFVEAGDTEEPLSATARVEGKRLMAEIRSWTAKPLRAEVVSPDGGRRIDLPLVSSGRHRWTVARPFSDGAPEGVWNLSVAFGDESGVVVKRSSPFVYGNAIWWDSNTRRIFPKDSPRFDRHRVRIAAAGNEWEAFQVAIASNRGLQAVTLRPNDLIHADGTARIAAGRITVEVERHSFVFGHAGLRSGLTPAPLLPWRQENVPAGTQVVAWVTVRVPKETPAGLYSGSLIARSSDGWRSELPVEFEVFDFSLPDVFSFTPLIGCGCDRGDAEKLFTSQRQTILDLYRYFGLRHITPTVPGLLTSLGPNLYSGTYHPKTKSVELEYSLIDEIIGLIESEHLDVKFLVHKGGTRVRGADRRYPGWIRLHRSDEPGQQITGYHGTPKGEQLFPLWLEAVRDHLRAKGWSDRVVLYTNDEDLGRQTNYGSADDLVTKFNDMIHKVAPQFRTYCADNAVKRWYQALEGTDFFTGPMSQVNLNRFRKLGNTWWGIYNRRLNINLPLGNARIVGLDCWQRGWKYQWQYYATHWDEGYWFNPSRLGYYPATAGYPARFFATGASGMTGFYMIYPWPRRRGPAWKPGTPSFAGSTHVEAIRESAEDHEYVTMLETLANRAKAGSQQRLQCLELLEKVRTFVRRSDQRDDWRFGGARATFLFDGDELQALRHQMGRTIMTWRAAGRRAQAPANSPGG